MQKTEIDLSVIFERFMGQPVVLEQDIVPITGMKAYQAPLDQNPALAEMEQLATELGLRFKVWTPNTPARTEFHANRINVSMKQNKSNSDRWEISGVANDSGSPRMTLLEKDFLPNRKRTISNLEPERRDIRIMKPLRLKKPSA